MSCWTRSSARRRSRTTASRSPVRSRSRTSFRTRARSSCARSRPRPTTSPATVLAQAIVRQGLKNVAAGANPLGLKRGIEVAVDQVVTHIGEQSKEISGKDQIARVATISAGDEEIGDVIAEEGQTFGMDLEFTEGMQFDKGYISPYMVTDQDRMEATLEDPYVLIAN